MNLPRSDLDLRNCNSLIVKIVFEVNNLQFHVVLLSVSSTQCVQLKTLLNGCGPWMFSCSLIWYRENTKSEKEETEREGKRYTNWEKDIETGKERKINKARKEINKKRGEKVQKLS